MKFFNLGFIIREIMWWTAQKWHWLMKYYKTWLRKEFKNGLVKKIIKTKFEEKKVWISEHLWSCFLCLSYKKLPWQQISFNKSATQFVSKMKTTVILGKTSKKHNWVCIMAISVLKFQVFKEFCNRGRGLSAAASHSSITNFLTERDTYK